MVSPALAPPPVRPDRTVSGRATVPPVIRSVTAGRPEAGVERLRGLRLVAVWLGMLLASWMVAVALGYGMFALLNTLAG